MMYYDESVLMALAEGIGKGIRVDLTTRNVHQGKFPRVCVEVDLSKPVLGVGCLCGHRYKVEYKGLHIICSHCGRYGHYSRDCQHHAFAHDEGQKKLITTKLDQL